MSTDAYTMLAPYYDLLHEGLTEDVDFVLALAARQAGRVLEVGCGTGRLLLPLAAAGFAVTGVDASAAMLARARQRLEEGGFPLERVQLVEAEMTALSLPHRDYALALVPFNTFFHLDPAAAVAACQRMRRHLHGDGRLFIDIRNPFLLEAIDADGAVRLEQTLPWEHDGKMVVVFASSRLKTTAQTLTTTWFFDASPPTGGPVDRTMVEITYHYYFPHQLELVLQQSGFRMLALWGDYDGASFAEESERLLVLAAAA